ncbi:hypothetical protein B0T19DRAFT_427459 [Cercophora scortea]|uniref:Uncharacterized protein n=1 Tax=Cercophora scortea TaxID=314031 RepID=A0AAE0IFJ8_9PEZI|nr:hypothetical protein B0T19DRAFT_427459 [Cercophora scortea]
MGGWMDGCSGWMRISLTLFFFSFFYILPLAFFPPAESSRGESPFANDCYGVLDGGFWHSRATTWYPKAPDWPGCKH